MDIASPTLSIQMITNKPSHEQLEVCLRYIQSESHRPESLSKVVAQIWRHNAMLLLYLAVAPKAFDLVNNTVKAVAGARGALDSETLSSMCRFLVDLTRSASDRPEALSKLVAQVWRDNPTLLRYLSTNPRALDTLVNETVANVCKVSGRFDSGTLLPLFDLLSFLLTRVTCVDNARTLCVVLLVEVRRLCSESDVTSDPGLASLLKRSNAYDKDALKSIWYEHPMSFLFIETAIDKLEPMLIELDQKFMRLRGQFDVHMLSIAFAVLDYCDQCTNPSEHVLTAVKSMHTTVAQELGRLPPSLILTGLEQRWHKCYKSR